MNNIIHYSGSLIYIQCNNTITPTFVTASASDINIIEQHRIRIINGEPVTTILEGGIEVKYSMAHLITNKNRTTKLRYKNGNLLDIRRENLTMPYAKVLNTCVTRNDIGVLILKNDFEVVMDKTDLYFAEQYNWSVSHKKNGHSVHTYILVDGDYKCVELGRYLMGLINSPDKSVIHIDGDPTNYIRDNLSVVDKRNVKSVEKANDKRKH